MVATKNFRGSCSTGEIWDKELDAVRSLEVPPELKAPVPFRSEFDQPPVDRTAAEKQDSRSGSVSRIVTNNY